MWLMSCIRCILNMNGCNRGLERNWGITGGIWKRETYKENEEENELYAKLNEFDPLEEGSNI